jgi:hypothetical protein
MAKRKVKVYGRLRLFETSCVGIPAYPDAHMSSDSFSLTKSVSKSFGSLEMSDSGDDKITKFKEETQMEENTEVVKADVAETKETVVETAKSDVVAEVKETEVTEVKQESVEVEKQVEAETVKSVEVETKSVTADDIMKSLKDNIKEVLKEIEVERGLVAQAVPKAKSIGELAMECGLFIAK